MFFGAGLQIKIVLVDKFPSPYGVSFILIYVLNNCNSYKDIEVSVSLWSIIHSYFKSDGKQCNLFIKWFPSPYGVSFILIYVLNNCNSYKDIEVSVSLWSIIHSYS